MPKLVNLTTHPRSSRELLLQEPHSNTNYSYTPSFVVDLGWFSKTGLVPNYAEKQFELNIYTPNKPMNSSLAVSDFSKP